ncbi:AraC family transcriptional regulator [Mangrovitalea sediminis]|uniref:AraC family transcriptional regulator n=1 Tax=Mangrovitalea sediminis TaxID=1982043 RepID=UPI000BE552F3|nr:AraC family transcriptional regulator [Mangrovitalea sediminis]
MPTAPHPPFGCLYLWHGHALIIGPAIDSVMHDHFALQMTVALNQPFTVETATGVESRRQALFWPGERHRLEARGAQLAHLFIDPGQRHLDLWRAANDPAHEPLPASLTEALCNIPAAPIDIHQAETIAQQWQAAWLPGFERAPHFDVRIRQALSHLAQAPEGRRTEDLARSVGLSSSRFTHLFSQQTGLSPSRYRIWQQLLNAVRILAQGASVTEAAHGSGFADLAHMSRRFHSTFGVAPSELGRMRIWLSPDT